MSTSTGHFGDGGNVVNESVVGEVKTGEKGTLVVFDVELANALASKVGDWRIVSSQSVGSARDEHGAISTSWLPLMETMADKPWVVLPPLDPNDDRDTWELVSAWTEEARAAAITDVKLCVLPGREAQASWVGDRKASSVQAIIEQAAPCKLRKQRPAQRRAVVRAPSGSPILDVENANVHTPPIEGPLGQQLPGEFLMKGACPVVVAVETIFTDLVPNQKSINCYRLAIALPTGEMVPISVPVPLHNLAKVDNWLELATNARATAIWLDPKPSTGPLIAAAIKASGGDALHVQALTRTGWYEMDGHAYYLTSTGGIGADGLDERCRAEIDYRLDFSAGFDMPLLEAWRKAFAIAERFVDPTPYLAVMLYGAAVLAGRPSKGALVLKGDGEAGKTSVLKAALAPYGGLMATWSGTQLSKSELLSGCHQAPGLVDDLPPKASRIEQEKQIEAFDMLLRRGYDSDVTYGRLQPSETSITGVRRLPGDKTAPGFCVSIETIPEQLSDTARQRMLIWETEKEKTWHPKAWDTTKSDWLGQPIALGVGASLLKSLAAVIDATGGLDNWLANMASDKFDFGEWATDFLATCTPRLRERLEAYLVGFNVLQTVWDVLEVPAQEVEAWSSLLQDALRSWSSKVKEASQVEKASFKFLDAVQASVASGRAVIASDDGVFSSSTIRIGTPLEDGSVALIARAVAEATSYSHDSACQLLRQLSGSPTKQKKINGTNTRVYVIPETIWYGPEGKPSVAEVGDL